MWIYFWFSPSIQFDLCLKVRGVGFQDLKVEEVGFSKEAEGRCRGATTWRLAPAPPPVYHSSLIASRLLFISHHFCFTIHDVWFIVHGSCSYHFFISSFSIRFYFIWNLFSRVSRFRRWKGRVFKGGRCQMSCLRHRSWALTCLIRAIRLLRNFSSSTNKPQTPNNWT